MSNFYANEEINSKIKFILNERLLENKEIKFGYFIISKKDLNDICIINNHPEWFDLYVKHRHQMVDPVVLKALSRIESFDWDEEIMISSKLVLPKVMLHAKEYLINSGHTFIIHDYKNNLALLSIFNHDTIKKEGGTLLNIEKQFSLFVKIHQKLLSLYEFFEKDNKASGINITKRENEILYWAAIGKTYKEIAIILSITEYTVKFHMAKIVNKLAAVNAKHAIRLASDAKLITTPQKS